MPRIAEALQTRDRDRLAIRQQARRGQGYNCGETVHPLLGLRHPVLFPVPEKDLDLDLREGVPAAPETIRTGLAAAARRRSRYMWAWETEPRSIAHGILDDETYDWLAVTGAMLESGGRPVVVGEATLEAANRLARETTRIDADHTGTAGLAGLVRLIEDGIVAPTETVAVVFSGVRRPVADPIETHP